MMDRPIAAFDIETIPDPELGRRMYGLEGKDFDVIEGMLSHRLEETGGDSDFLQPPFHKIVTISVAWLDADSGAFKLATLGEDPNNEAEQLEAFFAMIGRARVHPRLVSWNGRGFDVPVMHYRSMIHGVAAPEFCRTDGTTGGHNWKWNNYQSRFHEMHVDLMDVLAGYGASGRIKLDDMCRISGLPGKTVTEGHRVYQHILRDEVDLVREYCELDALNTLLLYLLWEVHRGLLEKAQLRLVVEQITEFISGHSDRPAWADYAEALYNWPSWSQKSA